MLKIQHNSNCQQDTGNGFLLDENDNCIGGYDRMTNGNWTADIEIIPEDENEDDRLLLGTYQTKNQAICALVSHCLKINCDVLVMVGVENGN
jgi:hypothetical protein